MAQRQPVYRRPSWAQRDKSYKYYMRKDLAADRSPGSDYGMENFSYDEAHLKVWQMPDDLRQRLPHQLRESATDWEYAGAAVCTALERIKRLDDESLHRGYPEKSNHLSRHGSRQAVSETPPMSSPDSPTPSMSSSMLPLEKLSFEGLPQRRIIGMESPPFTPVDSQACPTPDVPAMDRGMPPSAMPDAHLLTRQLSPLSIMSRDSGVAFPSPVFDENAWETYLNTFKAELGDIRSQAWVRFKGCGYSVDKLRIELGQERENRAVIDDFNAWWSTMKPKITEYEEKVRELEVPSIELVRMERLAQGLSA